MKLGEVVLTTENLGHEGVPVEDVIDVHRQSATPDEPIQALPAGLDLSEIEPSGNQTEAELDAVIAERLEEADSQVAEAVRQTTMKSDYFTAADQLDELQAAVDDSSISEVPLTKPTAAAVQASLETICRTVGVEMPQAVTLEAFGSKWSRQDASRLTMEGIYSTVKKVGSKIIEAIKAAWSVCAGFLANLLNNRMLLAAHIKGLKRKLESRKAWNPDKTVLATKLAHTIQCGGTSYVNSIMSILSSSDHLVDMYADGVIMIRNIRDGKAPPDPFAAISDSFKANSGFSVGDLEHGGKLIPMYLALPSATSIVFVEEHGRTELRYVSNQNGHPRNEEVPAMNVNQISTLLNRSAKVLENLRKVEQTSNTVSDLVKGILRRLENEYGRLRGAMGDTEYADKVTANREARCTQQAISKIITRFPATVFNAVRAACDYASLSIRNLKEA